MFASKTPRDLNRDPKPMIDPFSGRRVAVADESLGWHFIPRPEFDHVQHNEPNPILVDFRELNKATGNDLRTDAYLYLSDLLDNWEPHERDHWNHAIDVLGKFIRVKNLAVLESNE